MLLNFHDLGQFQLNYFRYSNHFNYRHFISTSCSNNATSSKPLRKDIHFIDFVNLGNKFEAKNKGLGRMWKSTFNSKIEAILVEIQVYISLDHIFPIYEFYDAIYIQFRSMIFCCCVKEDNIEDYHIAPGSKNQRCQINRPCSDMKVCQEEFNKPTTMNCPLLTQQSNTTNEKDNKKDSQNTTCSKQKPILPQLPKCLKKSRKNSIDQSQNTNQKSQLWQMQFGSTIFFSSHKVDEQMMFAYEIKRFTPHQKSLVNYALNANNNNCKTSSDSQQIFLCLVLTSRGVSQLQTIIKNIELRSQIRPVFGIYRQQEDYKIIKYVNYDNGKFDVALIKKNSFRVECFDRIIISAITESNFEMILKYFQNVTQVYSFDDVIKIELMVPNWVSLQQISLILSRLYRKFAIGSELQSIIKYLHFNIELIDSSYFQPAISIKNSWHIAGLKQNLRNIFEMKLLCAVNLVPITIEYNNFKILKKIINNLQNNFTVIKYLKLVQILRQSQRHFISNLQELKLFEKSQLLEIQSSTKVNRKSISNEESYLIITNKNNSKIEDMFKECLQTKRENKSSFRRMKEWDDDLKAKDIQITVANHEKVMRTEPCNLLLGVQESYNDSPDLSFCLQMEILQVQQGN